MTTIQDRLRERQAARGSSRPPRIDELLASGRALDHAAPAADTLARATAIVADLSAYVESQPPAQQAETAKRLVAALNGSEVRP